MRRFHLHTLGAALCAATLFGCDSSSDPVEGSGSNATARVDVPSQSAEESAGKSTDEPVEGTPEKASPVRVERGAPLTSVPEPAPEDEDTQMRGAISDVADGLEGVNLGDIQVIDGAVSADQVREGFTPITWMDLSLQDLPMEDLLDALLYPDEYEAGEFEFPERIKRHDGQDVAIVGYMIPLVWKETTVPEFMLVRDLLGCCFGGSPQPDEWISVKMKSGGAEYFPYIPVIVSGTFKIEGIEDEAGYAAGCFHIDGDSVEKEL